jgi:hypothetical protein
MQKLKAAAFLILFIGLGIIAWALSILIAPVAALAGVFGSGVVQKYGKNYWLGVDNAMSALLLGDPDECISSRLGKAKIAGSKLGHVADAVDLVAEEFFDDVDHCFNAIEYDEGKNQISTH